MIQKTAAQKSVSKKTRPRVPDAAPDTAPSPAPKAPKPAKAKIDKRAKGKPKPAVDQPRAPDPAPEPPPATAAFDLSVMMLTPQQREAMETLSMNLARAALTAQAAMAEAALRRADNPPALSADPFNAGPAFREVIGRLAAQPERLMRAQAELYSRYIDLWQSAAKRIGYGDESPPTATPAPGDRRFSDPEWQSNPVFDVIKQSYLLSSNWLNELIAGVEDVEPLTKRRAEFFTRMLTDAFSPSNFLISNPAALREAMDTRGESLVRGMRNFAADLERGGGRLEITQTDVSKFAVGVNVATAPGKVVFQTELLQILQFAPTTQTVHEIPLLIFPPWINKYYILDLRPENSMIRWLTGQGFTVFVASWVNPDGRLADKTFEDYMKDGVMAAVDAVLRQTGAAKVNAVGYCIAGTLLSCTLAYMSAKGDTRINSATFFAAQQDFSESGDLRLFTDEDWLRTIEISMDDAGGFLPGRVMSDTFNALRANDLVWSFFVSNYLMGKEPKAFDLLFWNSDQTRMPKRLHLDYLRRFYHDNALAQGELALDGVKLDLKKVKTPIFAMASREDHIAPYTSVYRGAQLFGGPVTFILAGSGHIAGVINAPVAAKYKHWTNDALPPTSEAWLEGAEEAPGSWWPSWVEWLRQRSGDQVPARDPAAGPLKPIEDAPGTFVKVKS